MRRRNKHDRGLTLPELLIVVTLMGTIAAVISSASIVTLRQSRATEGRTNVARSEASIDSWLPADLASTDVNDTDLPAVDLAPDAEPCTTTCNGIDMSGTNTLQLAWRSTVGQPGVNIVTRVQYQYIEVGDDWHLRRISCVGGEPCTVVRILDELDGPPDPDAFDPDQDSPSWVLDVSAPENPAELALGDNARKIVVTIDGGGDSAGAGGGTNSVSLTAGGRTTELIDADDFTVPAFVRARSRCGGPVTLVVDGSGSISSDSMNDVIKPGVREFIEVFRGTPVQIQVVHFDHTATAIGPNNANTTTNGGWHRYIDMTNDADITTLLSAVDSELTRTGATNWEEAFFRTFRESDGEPAQAMPNRVVFFTDGVPTTGRHTEQADRGGGNFVPTRVGDLVHFNAGEYDYSTDWVDPATWNRYSYEFDQQSWDRADVLLDQHRNVDLIFVGVGSGLGNDQPWTHNPDAYQNPSAPPAVESDLEAAEILAYLLANGPSGHVPATSETNSDGDIVYTNADVADFYVQNSFDVDAFASAMRTTALKDCGGTLTVQTRNADTGAAIEDEFVYENPRYFDDAGDPVDGVELRKVTTGQNFRTGTFDFELSDASTFFSVDVVPGELQTLDDYTMVGWTCRAGADARTSSPITIDGSAFEGIQVQVAADEAVSCIMNVRPS